MFVNVGLIEVDDGVVGVCLMGVGVLVVLLGVGIVIVNGNVDGVLIDLIVMGGGIVVGVMLIVVGGLGSGVCNFGVNVMIVLFGM